MADSNSSITNPLQTNNTTLIAIAYAAGVLASKFPIFDSATWSGILLAIGGAIFTICTAYINRKTSVVTTAANLPEVKTIEMDKTNKSGVALAQSDATPSNVVISK